MVGLSLRGHGRLAATELDLAAVAVLSGGWIPTTDIPLSRPEPTLARTPAINARMLLLALIVRQTAAAPVVGAAAVRLSRDSAGCRSLADRLGRITLKVQRDGRRFTVDVSSDGDGLVSHAGAALLAEAADRLGLTRALSERLVPIRERRCRHDPGRVVRDLAVMLADGGDCLYSGGKSSREKSERNQLVASSRQREKASIWRPVS